MNLRQKNKKLKRDLEFANKRVEYLEKAFSAHRRDAVTRERYEIDILKCSFTELADSTRRPGYECHICDSLTKKLAGELSKYMEVTKHTDPCGFYPTDVYEATVRVVRPRRKHDGLRAQILMTDELHGQKID